MRFLVSTISLITIWPWTSLWASVCLSIKCLWKIRDEIKVQFNPSLTLEQQPQVLLDKIALQELPAFAHWLCHQQDCVMYTQHKDSLLPSLTRLKCFTETWSHIKMQTFRILGVSKSRQYPCINTLLSWEKIKTLWKVFIKRTFHAIYYRHHWKVINSDIRTVSHWNLRVN